MRGRGAAVARPGAVTAPAAGGGFRSGFVSTAGAWSGFASVVAGGLVSAFPVVARSGFALTAPHFLLLRQKKVSKEKATPGYAVGCADFPALLVEPGGWLNSPLRGSNTASRNPPARLRCSALHMGPKGVAADKFAQKNTDFYGRLTKTPIFTVDRKSETLFPQPSAASSSAAGNGKKGEDCLRPAGPSSAAPRCSRAAQSTRHRRAPQRARLLFGYFFLARQEKVCPRVRRGNQRLQQQQNSVFASASLQANANPPAPNRAMPPFAAVHGAYSLNASGSRARRSFHNYGRPGKTPDFPGRP